MYISNKSRVARSLSAYIRGGATGYARYALAYPADPACIRVYILYLKKKTKTKEHLPVG
jgi:hypothetical protein